MYEPEVDDYVVWEQETWCGISTDQGWVYFKGDKVEPRKGFSTPARYITIETSVRPKPPEMMEDGVNTNGRRNHNPHKNIHTLLLCYEHQWHQLKFIKKRAHKHDDS